MSYSCFPFCSLSRPFVQPIHSNTRVSERETNRPAARTHACTDLTLSSPLSQPIFLSCLLALALCRHTHSQRPRITSPAVYLYSTEGLFGSQPLIPPVAGLYAVVQCSRSHPNQVSIRQYFQMSNPHRTFSSRLASLCPVLPVHSIHPIIPLDSSSRPICSMFPSHDSIYSSHIT